MDVVLQDETLSDLFHARAREEAGRDRCYHVFVAPGGRQHGVFEVFDPRELGGVEDVQGMEGTRWIVRVSLFEFSDG